ncbi:zinc finger CCCH domain-containing protein 22 [Phtheirospermum japonicum]|uniref:Zinc finger CCCH domain-containing protein 22 n=1 Tax=Phtheirospermum japonicum TaxID=374723 RepID=A0A830CUF4_9LAMI|nr:zinc finger CCCH domain-containing protein 22 [Phtheirospermum japonicum]
MDTYEATKVVMSRIQTLDPENASKIMGYILLQDQADKEMIRLAFGPETLLHSHIHLAKSCLGIPSSNPSTPLSNPMKPNTPFPRISIPNNGGYHFSTNNNSPSFQRASPRPFSYAAALNNNGSPTTNNTNINNNNHLSFLDDSLVDPLMSPSGRSDSMVFPYGEDAQSPHPFHRRSCSVNDAVFLGEEGYNGNSANNGWRTCMYFARGFCKNGGSCKFSHGDGEGIVDVGSPSKNVCGFDELLRIKALQQQQQQRFAAIGAHHGFGYSNSKCMDLMNENPRNDFLQMGLIGGANSSARQIYLTFPADSTFKEEDVSNYFSMFGPVQDVRIPYQQKRMFGFVTFVYSETVKLILAKGNPHFVCDSRVLVKPYKEKGKIPDKKQHQHLERGDYSACLSPSSIDSREHIDLPFEFVGSPEAAESPPLAINGNKQQQANNDDSDFSESLEHILPDNLFASPKKLGAELKSVFSQASASSTDDSISVTISSSNNIASLKSCYLQIPRLSSGQEAIEM